MTDTSIERPATSLIDGPPYRASILVSELIEQWGRDLDAREQIRRQAYEDGYADGLEAGRQEAEAEMGAWWARLARRIRADAARLTGPVPEPAERPRPDDEMWFRPEEWARLTERSGT